MVRSVLAGGAAVVGGWLCVCLVAAHPVPDSLVLDVGRLVPWTGPLRPIEFSTTDLESLRRWLLGLSIALPALALLAQARSFRLATRLARTTDRAARVAAELDSLRASYADLVERAYEIHYLHDLEGRLQWASDGAIRKLGLARDELAELRIDAILHPADWARVRVDLERLLAGDDVSERRVVRARTREGRWLWLELQVRVVRQDDRPVAVEGVALDVTSQRLAETETRLHGELARVVGEASSLEATLQGLLCVLAEALGWPYAEIWWGDDRFPVIRPVASWHGDDPELARVAAARASLVLSRGVGLAGRVWTEAMPLLEVALAADGSFSGERGGDAGLARALGLPIRVGGRIAGAAILAGRAGDGDGDLPASLLESLGGQIGILVDRRRAEQALRLSEARKLAVLETSLDCVITVDHEGQVLEFNASAERAFGYRRDEVLGERLADKLIPEASREAHRAAFVRCIETGERSVGDRRIEVEALRKDGTTFPAEVSVARIDGGARPLFTAHLRDITERREIDRLKDELVSTVSHELRTPLASMRGFVELLLMRDYPPQERQEFLEIVDKEILRLSRLIDDFLDVQRLEARRLEYAFDACDLGTLMEHVVSIATGSGEAHAFELALPEPPLTVEADADRMEQVLLNLVNNAVKYSPEGGAVSVTAARDGERARVSVRDEGIGMSPETLEGLFQKFFRADDAAALGIGGTGLGLALVKEIVTAHGGEVAVKSEPGAGSEFTLWLPLAAASKPSPGPADGRATNEPVPPTAPGG